jgi:hypothetical protein
MSFYAARKAMMINPIPAIARSDHPNLVAMWTMDNISGATLLDETVNNNDGAITGATAVSGKVGNALDFNGSTDFVSFGDILDSVITGVGKKFTLTFWINIDSFASIHIPIGKIGNTTEQGEDQRSWAVIVRTNKDLDFIYYSAVDGTAASLARAVTGIDAIDTWYMITLTFDQTQSTTSQAKISVNSVPQSTSYVLSAADRIVDSAARMSLGGQIGTAGPLTNPLNGQVDVIRIFDRLLIQTEDEDLYNGGVGI